MQDAPGTLVKPRKWPRARGPHYLGVLDELHRQVQPDWYLEIGTARGNSLKIAKGKCIAVDPDFRVSRKQLGDQPEMHMFHQTSDEFFASGALDEITPTVDLAFIDGMHLFEFVLRDFMAIEKHSTPETVILLHDLVPFSEAASERIWDPETSKGWSGDVWKMVPILRQHRPDLDFTVIDPRPSGLGMVSGLDAHNTVLQDRYGAILLQYRDMTITQFGLDRLADLQAMVPVAEILPEINLEDVA